MSGKNHFWAHKCANIIYFHLSKKKSFVSPQIYNINSFFLLCEWKKITWRFTSVQYHFSSCSFKFQQNFIVVRAKDNDLKSYQSKKRWQWQHRCKDLMWNYNINFFKRKLWWDMMGKTYVKNWWWSACTHNWTNWEWEKEPRVTTHSLLASKVRWTLTSMARILAKLMIEIIMFYLGGRVMARQLLGATLAKFVNKKKRKQCTKPWHDAKTGIQTPCFIT